MFEDGADGHGVCDGGDDAAPGAAWALKGVNREYTPKQFRPGDPPHICSLVVAGGPLVGRVCRRALWIPYVGGDFQHIAGTDRCPRTCADQARVADQRNSSSTAMVRRSPACGVSRLSTGT